jgi:hypothetical protein
MAFTRRSLIWIDAQGENVLHIVSGNGSLAGVMSHLQALSNAGVSNWWEAPNNALSPTPGTGIYPTVRVQAVLEFRDSTSGSLARLFIPAPLSTIFLGDRTTVDPSAIGGLISAVEGVVLAGSGNPVDQFVGGQIYATRTNAIASLQTYFP